MAWKRVERVEGDDPLGQCSWCQKEAAEDQELFGLNATLLDTPLSPPVEKEAYFIELEIPEGSGRLKKIRGMVTGADSPAREEGVDLIIVICSRDCGSKLKSNLEKWLSGWIKELSG